MLVGNGGVDTLQGGAGKNGDALADSSYCGTGTDTANADTIDKVAADCETVHKT